MSFAVSAAAESAPSANNDPLNVELLTMGPGQHPFFKFGHNAIRIRDSIDHSDQVYNFGTFSFGSPTLVEDFFRGRLLYWLSRDTMGTTLFHYASEHRSLIAQHLALSPAQKFELKHQLEINALAEHREYKYDYFFDNCSTRVRDAIDRAVGGQLRHALRTPAAQTLRSHALRACAEILPEYLALTIGLGPLVDRPTDAWAETFLPEKLEAGVRKVSIRSVDGTVVPLVDFEDILLEFPNTRPAQAPRWTVRFFAAGALIGLVFVVAAVLSRKYRVASAFFGAMLIVGGLMIGLLGLGLAALWALTDHAVAYRNQNLLLLSPLAVVLPWHGIQIAFRGVRAIAETRHVALLLFVSALLPLAAKFTSIEQQDNGNLIAFCLPCYAALVACGYSIARCHGGRLSRSVQSLALERDESSESNLPL
jgi:hypothetical protein